MKNTVVITNSKDNKKSTEFITSNTTKTDLTNLEDTKKY